MGQVIDDFEEVFFGQDVPVLDTQDGFAVGVDHGGKGL